MLFLFFFLLFFLFFTWVLLFAFNDILITYKKKISRSIFCYMDSTGGEQVVGLGVSKVQILAEKESFKQYSSGSSYVYPVLFCKI